MKYLNALLIITIILLSLVLASVLYYKPTKYIYVNNNNTIKENCICDVKECSNLILSEKNTINNFSKRFNNG